MRWKVERRQLRLCHVTKCNQEKPMFAASASRGFYTKVCIVQIARKTKLSAASGLVDLLVFTVRAFTGPCGKDPNGTSIRVIIN